MAWARNVFGLLGRHRLRPPGGVSPVGTVGTGRRDALPPGAVLRDYTVETVLGHGGFGIVYRACHNKLGHRVAIKEYLPTELAVREGQAVHPRSSDCVQDLEDGRRRFQEEAQSLIKFRNYPCIVTCMEYFQANGTAYLVMEYEDGLPLSEMLRKRELAGQPFTEKDLLTIAVPLLEGLGRVHAAGVVHRDIKPSNIFVRRRDEKPVLIDFGTVKQEVAARSKSMAPYTPGYAAFEQVEDGQLGPWTDVYGLGAVLWRMVAGGNPPSHGLNPVKVESRMGAKLRQKADPLPSARELGAGRFSLRVLESIDRCLELREADRVRDCDELHGLLLGGSDPSAGSFTPRFAEQWQRVSSRPGENVSVVQILQSAERGDPLAQLRVGCMYSRGQELPRNNATAAEWFRRAAEQGHAGAQFNLGVCYHHGKGLPKDHAAAAECFRRAAKQGHVQAEFNLGVCYRHGKGLPEDHAAAAECFRKAAYRGHVRAQYCLGVSFDRGEGVPKDQAEAAKWYLRAADQGLDRAQFNLGLSYRNGQGVPRDPLASANWFRRAASQGYGPAKAYLRAAHPSEHSSK